MFIYASEPFMISFWHVFITQMDPVITSKQSNIHSLLSAQNEDKWSVHAVWVWNDPGRRGKAQSSLSY